MQSRPIVLTNARLVDPATQREGRGALLVRDGAIADVVSGRRAGAARGRAPYRLWRRTCWRPGLVDMRAFVGEPGAEHRETLDERERGRGRGRRHHASSRSPTPTR